MRHLLASLTFVALLMLALASQAAAQTPTSEWVGEFRLGKAGTPINLHVTSEGATFDMPVEGARGVPLRAMKLDESSLQVELPRGGGVVVLDGKVEGNKASGTAIEGAARGTFTLVRLAPTDRRRNLEYSGSYRFESGGIVDMGPMAEQRGILVFLHQKTLREGGLYPLSDTEFVTGPTLAVNYPFAIHVTFTRDVKGAVDGLVWKEDGRRTTARKIAPHTREDVTVDNGPVKLKGCLLLPSGPGPHPAVIFAHGSGDATRDVGMWNTYFVRLGFAVLSLDKRGAGESTGDWRASGMQDIAGDWLAGIAMLKARPDIDPKRIGVHGSSQGGWTGPIMAATSDDVAFLIIRAGSGVGVAETMVHEIEWTVREAGFSEAVAKEAGSVSRGIFALATAGAEFEKIDAIAAPARAKPWGNSVWPLFMSKEGWGIPWCKMNAPHQADPWLRRVKCPVLWFLGDKDHNVPTAESERRLRSALAGNGDFTLKVLRNSDHGFLETTTGNNSEFPRLKRMAPGYWDTMESWLSKRFGGRPRRPGAL